MRQVLIEWLRLVRARTQYLNEIYHQNLPRSVLPEHESNASLLPDATLRGANVWRRDTQET